MPFKTGIGMDENLAGSMGLLQGLQGLGPAGVQRTASPAGSIAQNLMPIFGAMLQAKAMQQQAAQAQQQMALESMLKQAQIAHLLGGTSIDPEMQAAKLGKIKAETSLAEARAGAVGLKPTPTSTNAVISQSLEQELGRPPTATELNQAILGRQLQLAGATAQARVPAALAEEEAKRAMKKPMMRADREQFLKMTDSLDVMQRVIRDLSQGSTTRWQALMSAGSKGMLSNKTLSDYAYVYNQKAGMIGGKTLTANEIERLKNELPPPSAFVVDPRGFIDRLKGAYKRAANYTDREYKYLDSQYNVDPDIASDVERLRTLPDYSKKATHAENVSKIIDQGIKAGKTKEEVRKMVESYQKTNPDAQIVDEGTLGLPAILGPR